MDGGAAVDVPVGWSIASKGTTPRNEESARTAQYRVRQLPHVHVLEADPQRSRIQSQPDQVSTTGHAQECGLHAMPYQPYLFECRNEVRRLPR